MVPAEVVVFGGGPAGSAAARLLALWGHDVVLVTKPTSLARHLAESIPPSSGKLFDVLGVRDRVDAAGFVRSTGNTVWWGRDAGRVESFPDGALGWQVTAARFEPILQAAAAAAGVRLQHNRLPAEDVEARQATFILDCTGRAGVMARARGWRKTESGHRTVALVGRWRPPSTFDLPEPTHTVIESYSNGWAWSVPHVDGSRSVAVMVDPRTSNLAHDRSSRAVYQAEVDKTAQLSTLLRDAALDGGPFGWDASMYSATQYADDRLLLVGDAGSFIDPLSSAGVKKALASGWLAAIATHTALLRPHMRQVAFDFFAAREAAIYRAFRIMTEQFLADAASNYDHPFWSDRTDPENASDNEAVEAAFERLRAAESINLRKGPGVSVEPRPAVNTAEIVLESRLVTATIPDGVRYVRDVDLIALVDLAPHFSQVPDLFDAYNRRTAPVSLPDFLSALSSALAKGWLVAS